MSDEPGRIPLGGRVTIALIAGVLTLPAGCGACFYLLDRGIGSDSRQGGLPPFLVLLGILVLGTAFVYEVGTRVTGGRLDGNPFSMGAVAVCSVAGVLAGLYFVTSAPIEAAGVLGIAGALLGTFVPRTPAGDGRRRE